MGTHIDNMRDMRMWGNVVVGERQWRSKLSNADILNIRRIYKNGGYKYKDIGEMFSISANHASRIIRGEEWKHLNL